MLQFKRSIPIFFVLTLLASLAPATVGAAERRTADPEYRRTPIATSGSFAAQQEADFLSLVNQYRQSKGLSPLSRNGELDAASRAHSKDMAVNRYFSHTSLDGRSPWTRMAQAGYTCDGAKGENIAAGYSSAQAAFNAWRNSPGHNRNMLSTSFRAIGIGVYYDASSPYRYYWTTDFGACR